MSKRSLLLLCCLFGIIALVGCGSKKPIILDEEPARDTRPSMETEDIEPDAPSTSSFADDRPEGSDLSTAMEAGEKLMTVYFDFDRYNLKPKARTRLNDNARWLKDNRNTSVILQGHCDEGGYQMAESSDNGKEKEKPPETADEAGQADREPVKVTDRRFWMRELFGDKDDDQNEEEPERSPYPSFVNELKARTEAAEQKLKERINELESEYKDLNARRERDVERQIISEKSAFLKGVLPLQDDITRALVAAQSGEDPKTLVKGLQLIGQKFEKGLAAIGCEKIEIAGKKFDPQVSEAVSMRSTDDPELDGMVVEVVQSGYRIGDHLVQPAKVIVGRYDG